LQCRNQAEKEDQKEGFHPGTILKYRE
jgi:hypothetical protein